MMEESSIGARRLCEPFDLIMSPKLLGNRSRATSFHSHSKTKKSTKKKEMVVLSIKERNVWKLSGLRPNWPVFARSSFLSVCWPAKLEHALQYNYSRLFYFFAPAIKNHPFLHFHETCAPPFFCFSTTIRNSALQFLSFVCERTPNHTAADDQFLLLLL